MKKLFFLFVCAAIAAACSSEMEVPSPANPDDDMVEVSFNLAGDYVSVEETPMTRAFAKNAKTLYAVQINIPDFGREHEILDLHPYAWGLFSDMKNARISLERDKEYQVCVMAIIEREDTIFHREGHYASPFAIGSMYNDEYKKLPTVTDKFTVSHDFEITTNSAVTQDSIFTGREMAKIDRYQGKTLFKPSYNNGNGVEIEMERHAISFTYNVVPPLDGVIRVKLPGYGERVIYEVKAGDNQKTEQAIHNAPRVKNVMAGSVDVEIEIQWKRGREGLSNYSEKKTITVRRNNNYNININMNARDNETGFKLNLKETQFESGTTLDIN